MQKLTFKYNFKKDFYEIFEDGQICYTAHYLNCFFKITQRFSVRNTDGQDLIKLTTKDRLLIFSIVKIEIFNEELDGYEEAKICHTIKLVRNKFKLYYQSKYYLFDRKSLCDTDSNLLVKFECETKSCGDAVIHLLSENVKLFAIAITTLFLIDFIGEKYE